MEDVLPAGVDTIGESWRERIGLLFDRHYDRLLRLAARMTYERDESLDLVQETFLRAARRPADVPFDDEAAERWLVRVLVNICHDRRRRIRVRESHGKSIEQGNALSAGDDTIIASVAVRRALELLPPRQRASVVMYYLEDLDAKTIAGRLGIAHVTVRWHLAAARRSLMELLSEEGR